MLLNSSFVDTLPKQLSGEERALFHLELDTHPLTSGWVRGDIAKLKVQVLPPPTLILPNLGRGNLEPICTSHTSPVVKEPETGGWTVPCTQYQEQDRRGCIIQVVRGTHPWEFRNGTGEGLHTPEGTAGTKPLMGLCSRDLEPLHLRI